MPKTLLETDGRILSGPKYEHRILDTKYGKAVRINGGSHVWIYWVVCPTKTSQSGPDPHGMETLGGVLFHD